MPIPGKTIKFEAHHKKIKAPFTVYADFECKLAPVEGCSNKDDGSSTTQKHLHIPSSFAYLIKCSFDESLDCLEVYRGENSGEEFVRSLTSKIKDLYEQYVFNKFVPLVMSEENNKHCHATAKCHICEKIIEDPTEKVRDHCHMTGKYRGPAHNTCNTKYHLHHEVPVFFHNFSKYDSHLFITELIRMQSDRNIQIIPSNTETYISITKQVKISRNSGEPAAKRQKTTNKPDKQVYLRIEFKDSFRFLGASIDALAKSLNPATDFKNLHKFFERGAELLKRKGVFPYELIKRDVDYLRK